MTNKDAPHSDEYWMSLALEEAQKAWNKDEVPVGAVLVNQSKLVSKAHNLRESILSPLGHAELIALHRGSQKQHTWRLADCTLYVTLEPCIMCAGALVQSRVKRLVFGAFDQKGGGAHSLYKICEDKRLNHRLDVTGGVLAEKCGFILKEFFKNKRKKNPAF